MIKLYHYTCYEASKYFREAYIWEFSLKRVKSEVLVNYIDPKRIKIRLIGEETEEYCDQLKIRKENERNEQIGS